MINRNELKAKVIQIIKERFDVSVSHEASDKTTLKDLGIDSLAMVNLILAIEDEFNIDFYSMDIDMAKLNNVTILVDTITKILESDS